MSGRDPLAEIALATNVALRERVAKLERQLDERTRRHKDELEALESRAGVKRVRREQMRAAQAERKLADTVASPWVELPYLGVVPRYVGPGDPLRKLRGKRTSTLEGSRHD